MDSKGFVEVEQLIKAVGITKDQLDDKSRFGYSNDGLKIRCRQGHSIKGLELDLEIKTPPKILYHGTNASAWHMIQSTGLLPMSRQHVHLSADMDTAKSVGSRHKGETVVLQIDTSKMIEDAEAEAEAGTVVKFYFSENKVWLIDKVDPKYIVLV